MSRSDSSGSLSLLGAVQMDPVQLQQASNPRLVGVMLAVGVALQAGAL